MAIGIAGLAISGIGSLMGASGAKQAAAAAAEAAKKNIKAEDAFAKKQNSMLDSLISEKKDKLYDIGNIFDRFESTGAFGDTNTLKNLRQAQSDYSALAAGDFSGFESQLRKSMSDALITTVGSGSPVGAYAGLAADQMMAYRDKGVSTTIGISDYLSKEANNLLGQEFGILDQSFNTQYTINRTATTNKANYLMQQAATEGVGLTALGNSVAQLGGSLVSYGNYNRAFEAQQSNFAASQSMAQKMLDATISARSSAASSPFNMSASTGYNPNYAAGLTVEGLPSTYYGENPPPTGNPSDNMVLPSRYKTGYDISSDPYGWSFGTPQLAM